MRSEARLEPAAARTTSRSAVIARPGTLRLDERALPEPGPGQVRIRLEGSGLCGSNLPVWEGREWFDYPQAPGAPGHEGWGVIDAVGPAVDGLPVGTRVAALSYRAFADYDIAEATAVVALPPSLRGVPFPGEPLGCAMNVFRRAAIEPGQTVAIIGIGFLGALLTQLCTRAGARVVALSRRDYALEVARACGAELAIRLASHEAVVAQVTRTTGELCERVIECAGLQDTLDVATQLTRVRGRLVIAGYHQDGLRAVNMQLWNWRGIDVINAHEREPLVYVAGIRAAVDAVSAGVLDPAPLYTHRFPLDRLDHAFELARRRPDGFLKALVTT